MTQQRPFRLLVLMRHAHARDSSRTGDQGRELTQAGKRVAATVGEWLRAQGVRPDVVVLSPATRAVQTWEQMQATGLTAEQVWSDSALYNGAPADVIESVRAVDEQAETVLVVGHAPGIPGLALELDDHTNLDAEGRAAMDRWPPAALAVICHRGAWDDFPLPDSVVAAFHTP